MLWFLSALPLLPVAAGIGPGKQDFVQCCRSAVQDSIDQTNSSTSYIPSIHPRQIYLNPSTQICDAKYNRSDERGQYNAPEVWVPYSWCSQNCPGWQLSQPHRSNQWLVPLVGFIIPAVVFCLTVPRRYKLSVPDTLFRVDLTKISQIPMVPFLMVAAVFWVILDTLIWLAVVFVFAGPMLLSGFYEGRLDRRLLTYVEQQMNADRLKLHIRAQILFTVLVGNLQLDPLTGGGAAWKDVQGMVADLETSSGTETGSQDRSRLKTAIAVTRNRLKSMLACQYSFGSTVGAPVIFYTGGFIYTVVELSHELGDTDTSNALAFGIWWMAIPHVAIIGACLLAGNNPNTLEGIASYISDDDDDATTSKPTTTGWFRFMEKTTPRNEFIDKSPRRDRYGLVYQSRYQPVSMWHRGKSKQQWVNMLCDRERGKVNRLEEECRMRATDWITVVGGAMTLCFVPPALALLQNYYTPVVGIGCRATTVLLYMIFQFLLILLWIWDLSGVQKKMNVVGISIWELLVGFCAVATTFITVGGTMMQVMGVYRNCLCKLNIQDWIRKGDQKVLLTNRNQVHVHYARHTWLPLGIAATAFLCAVAYVAWWYQRHLRLNFQELVDQLGKKNNEGDDMQLNWTNSIPSRS
ncbi:MAG: hypothetical protein M1816_007106 [Peltula sp. TS41687]|nr:MAG: hypothetical protein M1816_007106 [Peltula sp. TS41687]